MLVASPIPAASSRSTSPDQPAKHGKYKGWIVRGGYPALYIQALEMVRLLFADAEHLGPAGRADALRGGLAVLHGNGFGIFHLLLGATLNAICFHS